MPDREKVIKGLEICYCPPSKCEDCPYHDLPDEQSCNDVLCLDALATLKEQPQIVRCKDCKHATMTSDGKMCKYCAMDTDDFGDQRDVYHDADWFCADGERREDDG